MTTNRDHPQAAPLCLLDEALEILHRPEIGIDRAVIGDVVAIVAAGRGIERQQPQRGDAEILQVWQFFGQPGEVADAVMVAVGKRLDVELVDDRVLVPEPRPRPRQLRPSSRQLRKERSCRGSSRQAAERERRIAIWIDAQPDSAPFDCGLLAGEKVLNACDVATFPVHAGRDVAKREPDLARAGRQSDRDEDGVGSVDRLLDEGDHVAIVGAEKAQIRRLLQRLVVAADAIENRQCRA